MINIGQIHNFIAKSDFTSKSQAHNLKDSSSFFSILAKERDQLAGKTQQNFKGSQNPNLRADNMQQDRVQLPRQKADRPTAEAKEPDKTFKGSQPSHKAVDSAGKEQVRDLEIQDTEPDMEEALSHIASLLQDLIRSMQANMVEDEAAPALGDVEVHPEQVQGLMELRDQLTSLMVNGAIEIADTLDSNREAIAAILERINKTITLDSADEKDSDGKILAQLLDSLQAIKDPIEPKESLPKLSTLDHTDKIDLGPKDEVEAENLETAGPAIEAKEGSIKVLDKPSSAEGQEDQLSEDLTHGKEALLKEELIAIRQEVPMERINVTVVKDKNIEPRQFINEIAQKASLFLSKDKNEISIQLTPENLGRLSIKVGLNEGSLTGKIYAENYSVKEVIETNLNQLKDALEEKGLNISGLEVHIGDSSQSFERGLYESRFAHKSKNRVSRIESSDMISVLEEENSHLNPYLVTSQFEGTV